MKKLYSLPGLILSAVFLVITFFFVWKSYEHSTKFREEKSKIAEILNMDERLFSARDWLFTEEAWQEKKAEFETVIVKADDHMAQAKKQGIYVIYISIAYLIIIMAIYFKRRKMYGLTMGLSFVCISLLGVGVMNPILEMEAYKEDLTIQFYVEADEIPYYAEAVIFLEEVAEYVGYVDTSIDLIRVVGADDVADSAQEVVGGWGQLVIDGKDYLVKNQDAHVGIDKVFPGKTYFYYQNKGIIEVITMLWKTDNRPVAISIGLFSVIIPVLKLISTLIILLTRTTGAKRFRKVLSFLAKWSMADVFVVSLFLAFLSFSNMSPGVTMDAKILFGMYYFFVYVLLSIGLGFFLDLSIKERKKNLERAEASKGQQEQSGESDQ
ncbi:paraquat-inducible protein A [Crocinitomicaceae bacterium]|nr:paraquat-inducible protein A [Crocinitomicaceae bacterium]MDC0257378.1 paraquat-inducible protein A [Crocinitomicaceae bacterium]